MKPLMFKLGMDLKLSEMPCQTIQFAVMNDMERKFEASLSRKVIMKNEDEKY